MEQAGQRLLELFKVRLESWLVYYSWQFLWEAEPLKFTFINISMIVLYCTYTAEVSK